ncbi:MAG: helix-turn-helix domain-containing protein [Verrucomicrobiales bacterium]
MLSLREIRKQANLTQADLAAGAGIRQATLSALENGRSKAHPATIRALAEALETDPGTIRSALAHSRAATNTTSAASMIERIGIDWPFLTDLDPDLRAGLARSLIAEWTHSSTALEGNTISAGDTLFVLTEGLTVNGKSLREHQEIHGHAQALGLMAAWTGARQPIRVEHLHQLHRAIQTGAEIDALAPLGSWKIEANGTTAITTGGTSRWHDYAAPQSVPGLMAVWLNHLVGVCRNPLIKSSKQFTGRKAREFLLDAYTDAHLGFVGIHPYADGNGRMARLLANIPVLRAGHPPILVSSARRRKYITLLGDYSLSRGQPEPGEALVASGDERDALKTFFSEQWQGTLQLVAEFRKRQSSR